MINEYKVLDMRDWENVGADLVITDPPFGLEFDGKKQNYNRDTGNVVSGYVEWAKNEYTARINELLSVIKKNTKEEGQALIFSGWNNSNNIHNAINNSNGFKLQGKLYWSYNFAPYCRKRPAHNVYEIFWIVRGDNWYYDNKCGYDHCKEGEANLSSIVVERDYKKEMPKYPTRLPLKLLFILLDHFSKKGDLVFDPLAGSGMLGIASDIKDRNWVCGDLNEKGKKVFRELVDHYKNNEKSIGKETTKNLKIKQ